MMEPRNATTTEPRNAAMMLGCVALKGRVALKGHSFSCAVASFDFVITRRASARRGICFPRKVRKTSSFAGRRQGTTLQAAGELGSESGQLPLSSRR